MRNLRNTLMVIAILAILALLGACRYFVPQYREGHQVCTAPDTIWVYTPDRSDSLIGGIAKVCWDEYGAPTLPEEDGE